MAEYSMLKGRPVPASLSSLIALVESVWKDASGRRGDAFSSGRTFWNLEKNLDMVEDVEGWGGHRV